MKKSIQKLTAALVVLFIFSGSVFLTDQALAAEGVPDWNRAQDTLEGALGLHYGKLSGHGLAFRMPLKWFLYFQAAGGIWHTKDRERHNVGFELNYILRQDDRVRIFLVAGMSYFSDNEKTGADNGADVWQEDYNWNQGVGVGLEFLQGHRWSLQAELDFVHDGKSDHITIAPQAGIFYYW